MENSKKGKMFIFIKKYMYYFVALLLILGVTLALVLSSGQAKKIEEEVNVPTQTMPVVFGLPVNSPIVLKWYSDTELMYNETLNQWESHKGLDIVSASESDLSVYSVLDGVVTNIEDSYEFGTILTITHDNGFVSKYSSLDANLNVEVSDSVKKGQLLGVVTDSATNEQKQGKHLHFELFKDGQKVDPANYLSLEDK